jgi:hypothetical protein
MTVAPRDTEWPRRPQPMSHRGSTRNRTRRARSDRPERAAEEPKHSTRIEIRPRSGAPHRASNRQAGSQLQGRR